VQHGNCRVYGVNINCFRLLSRLNYVWDGSQVSLPLKLHVRLYVFCIRSAEYFLHIIEIKKKLRDEITTKGRNGVTGNLRTCSFFIVLLGGCIKDVESWACEEARNTYNVGV